MEPSNHPRNQLLAQLPRSDLELMGPASVVDLPIRYSLEIADEPIDFVYFIEEGVASVVEDVPPTGAVEVGVIGYEGMTGLAFLFDDTQSPFDTYMQVEGQALRFDAKVFDRALRESTTLRPALLRYARAFTIQIASTAFSNGRSSLAERLARWILMVGDRTGDTFSITHEFLSTMLAVRRAGVTEGLQALEGSGLIRTTRGHVEIVSRERLIEASHGSYGRAESEYGRLLPQSLPRVRE